MPEITYSVTDVPARILPLIRSREQPMSAEEDIRKTIARFANSFGETLKIPTVIPA